MNYAFYNCSKLVDAPLFDMSKVKDASNMFGNCSQLKTVPSYNSSLVTGFGYFFQNCTKITSVGKLNGSSCISLGSMFRGNKTSFTDFGGIENLGQAYSTSASANYSSYALDLSTCTALTHDSLMNVINNLYDIASVGVQQQRLILGSTNLAKLDVDTEVSIATNKGWSIS